MASIEIILRVDDGKIINQSIQTRYELSLGGERLSEIEEAVEGVCPEESVQKILRV